jgi:hypothetical protein
MKTKVKTYENYPGWMVLVSNLFSLAVYILGAYILYKINIACLILYILYILILEFRVISRHCTNCYYYGKRCCFGKGKISSLFFKKGNPNKFCKMQVTCKNLIPDFLVSVIPIIAGIILLIIDFRWDILIALILLFILGFPGSAFIRGNLACKYCRQRELGCPAEKLFNKNKK